MDELLTMQEAAEQLRVSLDAVYRMVRRGDITPVYLPTPHGSGRGLMRLRAADVHAYKPRPDAKRRPKKPRGNTWKKTCREMIL